MATIHVNISNIKYDYDGGYDNPNCVQIPRPESFENVAIEVEDPNNKEHVTETICEWICDTVTFCAYDFDYEIISQS